MQSARLFILLFLSVLAFPGAAHSCLRTAILDMDDYIDGSLAIFTGEMANDKPSITSNPYWIQNRYRVMHVFKGPYKPGDVVLMNERTPRRYFTPDNAQPTQELVTVYKSKNPYNAQATDVLFRKDYHQTECEKFSFTYPELMKRLRSSLSSKVKP